MVTLWTKLTTIPTGLREKAWKLWVEQDSLILLHNQKRKRYAYVLPFRQENRCIWKLQAHSLQILALLMEDSYTLLTQHRPWLTPQAQADSHAPAF